MEHKYFGTAHLSKQETEHMSTVTLLERALRPLANSVGLDETALAKAVDRDISRRVARAAFDQLESEGIRVDSSRVLDLGAGLGHASVEAVNRGCDLIAIEPGVEWCNIVAHRLASLGKGVAIVGDGERLPFADNTFDLVISIGVLEHVRRPNVYLREAYRVLKPGGSMFLSCENYLSFWEPHYQLAWLPLFPKRIASIYLRLRGKSSSFLMSSITYTTRPGVNRSLRAMGFQFKREMNLRKKLDSFLESDSKFSRISTWGFKAFAKSSLARVFFEIENCRKTFTPYFSTIVQKPALPGTRETSKAIE